MRKTVTAACFVVVTSFAALAASAFEGVWKVKSIYQSGVWQGPVANGDTDELLRGRKG
jgi:hypothetical protein